MLKLLGILDLLLAVWILCIHFSIFESTRLTIVFVLYLAFKVFIFWGDFASILDGICAIYLIALAFGFNSFLSWFVLVYFFQKGLISLL